MRIERPDERLLSRIIVYGFSLSFGLVVASLQALNPGPLGFTLRLSWWTLLSFGAGTGLMLPLFRTIVYSERKLLRHAALAAVVLFGLAAFFYPMRMVPSEKFGPIFIGLGVALTALAVLATFLMLLYRFFEKEN
ncbi:MAG TPA: hypothetical protein VL793_15725 [Patescibacteria group bacterium]|jgi:hypothetical protein|nr:hypothetical protein [Patescibacteria group bacterium]